MTYRHSDKIVRRGDYYELEQVEEATIQLSHNFNKDDTLGNNASKNDNDGAIVTKRISYGEAYTHFSSIMSAPQQDEGLSEIIYELEQLTLAEGISDETKSEAIKMIKEAVALKSGVEYKIPAWLPAPKQSAGKDLPNNRMTVQLEAELPIASLEARLQRLQAAKFGELARMEQMLAILCGEKKLVPVAKMAPMEEKTKQEIQSLYASMNNLKCVNQITDLVDSIETSSEKFNEMRVVSESVKDVINNQNLLRSEAQEGIQLIKDLQTKFRANIAKAKKVVENFKVLKK